MHRTTRRTQIAWLVLVAVGVFGTSARSQDPSKGSLAIVPPDASFYVASMNHTATWKAIVESNAYRRVLESPVGEKMRKALRAGRSRGFEQFGSGNPIAEILKAYAEAFGNPGSKVAMPFLRELFANEIFVYADAQLPKLIEAIQQVQFDMVRFGGLDEQQLQVEMLRSIKTHCEGVTMPTVVVGAVLSDPSNFRDLLKLAHSGVKKGLESAPPAAKSIVDHYRVVEDETSFMLTLTIDAESIPWDKLEIEADIAPLIDELRSTFSQTKLSIAVGVKNHFLIATIGPSLNHLTAWGSGPRLLDAPKLAPLKSALESGQALTAIHFYSADYARISTDMSSLAQAIPLMVETALHESDNEQAKEELLQSIRKDAGAISAELGHLLPKRGESFGFSFLTNEGIEGFQYDFSERRLRDDSRPLELLHHAGDNPALVVVARGKGSTDQIRFVRKWSETGLDYVEKYLPIFGGGSPEIDQFLDQLAELRPMLKELGEITETKAIPATDGGETSIVLDFAESRHQWHTELPPSSFALPAPSFAAMLQINDADLIKSAGRDYLALANELVDWLRLQPNVEMPADFRLVPPEVSTSDEGEIFSYRLPAALGIDEAIAPHARLDNGLLVFSYVPRRSAALVKSNEPVWEVPMDWDRSAAWALYVNAGNFIDAINAWLHYAVEIQEQNGQRFEIARMGESDLLDFDKAELMETWDRVVDLAKCFRGIAVINYSESDATITHYRMKFVDVPQ